MVRILRKFSYALVILGALNWGLVGLLQFDLIAFLFGYMTLASRIIYSLVGISAIVSLATAYSPCVETEYYCK